MESVEVPNAPRGQNLAEMSWDRHATLGVNVVDRVGKKSFHPSRTPTSPLSRPSHPPAAPPARGTRIPHRTTKGCAVCSISNGPNGRRMCVEIGAEQAFESGVWDTMGGYGGQWECVPQTCQPDATSSRIALGKTERSQMVNNLCTGPTEFAALQQSRAENVCETGGCRGLALGQKPAKYRLAIDFRSLASRTARHPTVAVGNHPIVDRVEGQPACKPGSVRRQKPCGDHSSGTPLARRLKQPTRTTGPERAGGFPPRRPYSVLLPVGFTMPRPLPAARWALTPPFHPYPAARGLRGGLLSVALSLGSPPPGVTRHRSSLEPGLSSPAAFRRLRERPPGRLAGRGVARTPGPVKGGRDQREASTVLTFSQ